jgi:hypothetical protein
MGDKQNIYYLEIVISYKKGKSIAKLETWAVSKYDTPQNIMRYDSKTMNRLNDIVYGRKYKSARQLVITKILSKKIVGQSLHST